MQSSGRESVSGEAHREPNSFSGPASNPDMKEAPLRIEGGARAGKARER